MNKELHIRAVKLIYHVWFFFLEKKTQENVGIALAVSKPSRSLAKKRNEMF